ncbi:type VI secretion system lipoprotein TssJ [Puniceibacterium sp. IMCC21224]|uniref:type VI secretion system lipoprotein TssJ n=1 Tax=Puniceibacterium sp. IMCC21224 TaxID=1618204 RepID=UPI00064D8757|nr:type VI secretion system lipoprotein TssJ [Puniceibacterium sp. IMCC21224]KMK65230.1 type VI secretion lipoprotein, VC_A0113 family [Puniceibacterium sp. IMCC21224]
MILVRRTFLLSSAAGIGLILSGCGEDAPNILTVRAQAGAGMNPGPDGSDRPVTLSILQLSGSGAFDAADYFALQNPASALGSDLVKADQLVLAPGGSASRAITIQPTTSIIGVVGGFINPTGRTVRSKIAAPGASQGLIISVGASGLSLATA